MLPLQRAANETQYTLSRTCLQEAYLTVNWERQYSSISQRSFDLDSSQQKLVFKRPVNGSISAADHQGETNKGMIIGIAVGVAVAVVLISGGIATVFIIRKRKRKQQGTEGMVKGTDGARHGS
ncbi:MAG: hypothetical protein LQ337_006061 [Flavoplaca oasis]|nr:MAG: hypothetical protein LQ337_006061 [Flavoplaca oasis]